MTTDLSLGAEARKAAIRDQLAKALVDVAAITGRPALVACATDEFLRLAGDDLAGSLALDTLHRLGRRADRIPTP